MPPKRFCQLRSRVTRRGGKPKEEPLKLKESFYAAPAPCLSLSAPSTEAAKSRRLGSHLLYIRRCPISRTQHLNKTTTLVAKKRISRTHLAWPGLSSGGLLHVISLLLTQRHFLPSIITPVRGPTFERTSRTRLCESRHCFSTRIENDQSSVEWKPALRESLYLEF